MNIIFFHKSEYDDAGYLRMVFTSSKELTKELIRKAFMQTTFYTNSDELYVGYINNAGMEGEDLIPGYVQYGIIHDGNLAYDVYLVLGKDISKVE